MKLDKILQIARIDKELINEGSFYSELPKFEIFTHTFVKEKYLRKTQNISPIKYMKNLLVELFSKYFSMIHDNYKSVDILENLKIILPNLPESINQIFTKSLEKIKLK